MYLRHRSRLVQQSIYEDLNNTLIACRWSVGTTTRPVLNPATDVVEIVTTEADDAYPLTGGTPITLIDYFPEDIGEITSPNTLAVDVVRPEDPTDVEVGSSLVEQPYVLNYALFAASDGCGTAVMGDLQDRYDGKLLGNGSIDLYDYLNNPATPAARMEIEIFRWTRDINGVAPETHLFFGELTVVDFVD